MNNKTIVSQHTPGPWHLKQIGDELYVESEHGMICDMQFSDTVNYSDQLGELEEIKANARLIAAAPLLLETAKALDSHCRAVSLKDNIDRFFPITLRTAWKKAREAISAAERKQS